MRKRASVLAPFFVCIGGGDMAMDQEFQTNPRARLLQVPQGKFGVHYIVATFALLFALWHVATNVYLNEPGLWQNAIHFAGFGFLAAVTISPWGSKANPDLGLDAGFCLWLADCRCRSLGGKR